MLASSSYGNSEAFDTIFNCFHSRGKHAVEEKMYGIGPLVKDMYTFPVRVRSEPPQHMRLLDHCEVQFSVSERALLVTLVVNRLPETNDGYNEPLRRKILVVRFLREPGEADEVAWRRTLRVSRLRVLHL